MNEVTIEIALEEAKERVKLRDALERLKDNSDFKTVIMNDYLKEEAQRLVYLRSDPNVMFGANGEAQKKHNELMLDGIAALKYFMHTTKMIGDHAELTIKEHYNDLSNKNDTDFDSAE